MTEVEIKATDLRIDVFRSGGTVAGTTGAPVEHHLKVTHLPTGIVLQAEVRPGESDLEVKSRLLDELRGTITSRLIVEEHNRLSREVSNLDRVRNALTHLAKLRERFEDGTIAESNSSALDCLSLETATCINDAWDDVNYHAEEVERELRAVVGVDEVEGGTKSEQPAE